MTFPGTSVTEWMVCCGRDSAAAKVVLAETNVTYLDLGPEPAKSRDMFEPLLSVLLLPTNRSRIDVMAVVFVQGLRDEAHVLLFECPTPF